MEDLDEDCASCGEECPKGECPKSKRPCGHHCNHSWSHDECCWCGEVFGEIFGREYLKENTNEYQDR